MVRSRRCLALLLALVLPGPAASVVQAGHPDADIVAFGDLPRRPRTSSDAPLFAGPATLKVNGGSGTYHWTDVFFGAREVRARVTLVPAAGAQPCAAAVRLGERGSSLLRGSYRSDPARKKSTHVSTVETDYRTVPLVVASDCAAWSLAFIPQDDQQLAMKLSERNYPVYGRTVAALERGTDHIDGKWAAAAWSVTEWEYQFLEREDACHVLYGTTSLKAWLKMPEWHRPRKVDRVVANEWRRVRANILLHELGHVTIALQGAAALDDWLDSRPSAPSCKGVHRLIDKKAAAILRRHDRRQDRYDRLTGHGRTQGTWFE